MKNIVHFKAVRRQVDPFIRATHNYEPRHGNLINSYNIRTVRSFQDVYARVNAWQHVSRHRAPNMSISGERRGNATSVCMYIGGWDIFS